MAIGLKNFGISGIVGTSMNNFVGESVYC